MSNNEIIKYKVFLHDLSLHTFEIYLEIDFPDTSEQLVTLPAWIPGSYKIREFAKNIIEIKAESDGKRVELKKIDKQTWKVCNLKNKLIIFYKIYAWDHSVRAAHLDNNVGFFNGTSIFLQVTGKENCKHIVEIFPLKDKKYISWRVATAMRTLDTKKYCFGKYFSENYDELIDHPFLIGTFEVIKFKIFNCVHEIIINGKVNNLDKKRLSNDLKKICKEQISFFEPQKKIAPIKRYLFLIQLTPNDYGGLEHRASSSLICSRFDLPSIGNSELSKGYLNFLSLCSHEYFHTWNVKRIKPEKFITYDFSKEKYTKLLWIFEGFTSYYESIFLLRSGIISEKTYLKIISATINNVYKRKGRFRQNLSESSFDAWTKFYLQDENSQNSIISYYSKGSLVALYFDLIIRFKSVGKKSLDDIMRALWIKYGKNFYKKNSFGTGVDENEVLQIFEESTSLQLKSIFNMTINSTKDIPLKNIFSKFGLILKNSSFNNKITLNIETTNEYGIYKISKVFEGGVAHKAGLSSGDILVSIDNLQVKGDNLEILLGSYIKGQKITIHVFRNELLMIFYADLNGNIEPSYNLSYSKNNKYKFLRNSWLHIYD